MTSLQNLHYKIIKNNICEVMGSIDDKTLFLFNNMSIDVKNHDTVWYAYFIDEPEKPIFQTFDPDRNKKLPFYFVDYLNRIKPDAYHDILILCTLYMRNIKLNKKKHQSFLETIDSYTIKEILKPTHGALVFTYQLEEIYAYINRCNMDEAVLFRKYWNKKNKEFTKQISKMKIQRNMTLFDLITNTTTNTNCFVFSPNYQGTDLIIKKNG